MRTRSALAALTVAGLATTGALIFPGAAYAADTTVRDSDIAKTETAENYNSWHNGAAGADTGAWASTPEGLDVAGRVQIIKGEETTPADLVAYSESLKLEANGDAWYQLAVGMTAPSNGGSARWTTLRKPVDDSSGNWTTSKALSESIEANSTHSIRDLDAALKAGGANYRYMASGFYVHTGARATISSFSAGDNTANFSVAPPAGNGVQCLKSASDIASYEDDSTYMQWHRGTTQADALPVSWTKDDEGLHVDGKARLVTGIERLSYPLASFVAGVTTDADTDDSFTYQISFFFKDSAGAEKYATVLATREQAEAGTWMVSREVNGIAPFTATPLTDIAAAAGATEITAYGFLVNEGGSATVRSYTANGTTVNFTKCADASVPPTEPSKSPEANGVDPAPSTSATTAAPATAAEPVKELGRTGNEVPTAALIIGLVVVASGLGLVASARRRAQMEL